MDDIAAVIAEMDGYAGETISKTLKTASRVFAFATRRGMVAENPVGKLDRDDRPRIEHKPKRVLSREEIGSLLAATTDHWRVLLTTAVHTGVRQSELLRLLWRDIAAPGVQKAGLEGPDKPRLGFHSLRHTWGSALMASGADVADVSRQMGHTRIRVTLDVYRHEWSAAQQAEWTRRIAEKQFGGLA